MGSRSQESQNLFWQDSRGDGGNKPSFKNPMNFRNGEAEFWTEGHKKMWSVTGTPDNSNPKTKCDQVLPCAGKCFVRTQGDLVRAISLPMRDLAWQYLCYWPLWITKRIGLNYVQPNWRHLEPANAIICFQTDVTQPLKRYESFVGFPNSPTIKNVISAIAKYRIAFWDVPITTWDFNFFHVWLYIFVRDEPVTDRDPKVSSFCGWDPSFPELNI